MELNDVIQSIDQFHVDCSITGKNHFQAKIDRKIAMYENGLYRYNDEGLCLQKVREYGYLLKEGQIVYHHSDYHVGNMLVDQKGQLCIIDFDRFDNGDAYEEFNRIRWCVSASHAFASGRVNGYFDGSVPAYFWQLLKLYVLNNALSSLPWAEDFGDEEISVMREEYQKQRDYYGLST